MVVSAAAVWLRNWPVASNDFGVEAAAAYRALVHGHPLAFLRLAPAYGGSLELRSPFALLSAALGGGEQTTYRLVATPCLLAAAVLGAWLAAHVRARGSGGVAALLVLGVATLNPLTYRALMIGHPEELLGGVLCAAAVLCAARGRAGWAGLLLGLAVANKQWALLAVGPVLLALPERRGLAMIIAGTTATAFLLPLALGTGGVQAAAGRLSVNDGGPLFHPQQLWWFAGRPRTWTTAMSSQIPHGFRFPPDWLQGRAHAIVVLSSLPLSALAVRRGGRGGRPLLVLALVMMLRCALDPWDVVYYPLPFIVALLAWEASVGSGLPILSLTATAIAWLLFEVLPAHVGVDAQAIAFAATVLPAAAAMAGSLFGPARSPRRIRARAGGPARRARAVTPGRWVRLP